jgi:hypothetical protein
MGETIEKIYCHDRDDSALTAAILANNNNRRDDYDSMAAWMNNPFAYIMFLALFRNGGFGVGNDNATQGIETQAQLNAIRTQLQDNQNAECIKSAVQGNTLAISQLAQTLNMDFNTVQKCCCDIQAAIQSVAGQVGFSAERVINAVNLGDCNVIQALKDCCCATQKSILEMGYQSQLQTCQQTNSIMSGINTVNTGLERGFSQVGNLISQGFSQVGFQAQQDKCDIISSQNANTQRIIDTLNAHWTAEKDLQIQDLKFQLSQERQNRLLLTRLGGNCGACCEQGCGY